MDKLWQNIVYQSIYSFMNDDLKSNAKISNIWENILTNLNFEEGNQDFGFGNCCVCERLVWRGLMEVSRKKVIFQNVGSAILSNACVFFLLLMVFL